MTDEEELKDPYYWLGLVMLVSVALLITVPAVMALMPDPPPTEQELIQQKMDADMETLIYHMGKVNEAIAERDELIRNLPACCSTTPIFPTRHPYVTNDDGSVSNVMTWHLEYEGSYYVIPVMWDGVEHLKREAVGKFLYYGKDKYPKFWNRKGALNYSAWVNNKVCEHGNLKKGIQNRR